MFVAERFLYDIVKEHGKHSVSTDGGTGYPQTCRFLKLNHHMLPLLRKTLSRG